MHPRRLLLLATAFVLALAAWVSRGAIGVTDAASWPGRIGILPSRWAPPVLALVLVVTLWRAQRSTLLVLLIPGVLLLPWLPIPVPAVALIWTHGMVIWIWSLTAAAAVAVAWPRWSSAPSIQRFRGRRGGSLAALGLALILYGSCAWLAGGGLPGGDEPHYLVITQSLLNDGDLQVENNYQRGDYRAYYPGDLQPDHVGRGGNGAVYSTHVPGFPALILPAFAAAGYRGVVIFLVLLSALGTWMVWRAGYRLTRSVGAAWFGWASAVLAAPFFVQVIAVNPDATAATILAAGVLLLVACEVPGGDGPGPAVLERGAASWVLIGGMVAALPWLDAHYAGVAVLLGAFLVARLLGRRAYGRAVAFAVLPLAGAMGWFAYFRAIDGTAGSALAGASYATSALVNLARGLPALLLDQHFGVLPNAPVYAIGLAGLGSLFRLRRRLAVEMTLLVCCLLLVSAGGLGLAGWRGPARLALPALLVLGVPAAVIWSRLRPAGRATALVALATSALITGSILAAGSGRLVASESDGYANWLARLTPVADLPHAIPDFRNGRMGIAAVQTGIWALCLGACALVAGRIGRRSVGGRRDGVGGLALRTVLSCAAAAMVAVTGAWAALGAGGPTPTTSALGLLQAYDPAARPVGVGFKPFGRIAIDQVPSRLTLVASNREPSGPDGPLLVLAEVPPGIYRLAPATALAAQGTVTVTIGASAQAIARWTFDAASREKTYRFELPAGASAVVLSGDALARRTMSRVAVEPVSVTPAVWRFTAPRAVRAARYGDVVAFAFDPDAYLEDNGIWVAGAAATPMVFAGPPGSTVVRLLVRNGPVANEVTLRAATRTDRLPLGPGETRVVELPVEKATGGALVEVTTARGYRPAEVDPTTRDRRYLGVWIQDAPGR